MIRVGSTQIMNVIDSYELERNAGGKPQTPFLIPF